MKSKLIRCFLSSLFVFSVALLSGQSIDKEKVSFRLLKLPKNHVDKANRTFKVTVSSPYSLTAEEIIARSELDFQNELDNFDQVVAKSKLDFQNKLNSYDKDVAAAKEKFELESAEFKKLSLLERLTLTDQGKNPKLSVPSKPAYYPPAQPVYRKPNLNDYILLDNNILASQILLEGYSKDGRYLEVDLDIQKLNFQDNNGQTYANQPTRLVVKLGGEEKINKMFFEDFTMVSSSPSNNINKTQVEKAFVDKVVRFINIYLNEEFGYQGIDKYVIILSVKNKDGKYDDLEKANIFISTNLKKLNPQDEEITKTALTGIQRSVDIWTSTLEKIDYKNKKADFNAKIAEMLYFNLMRVNLALENKKEAEKWLNALQENLIYMDMSSENKNALKEIETKIYKGN